MINMLREICKKETDADIYIYPSGGLRGVETFWLLQNHKEIIANRNIIKVDNSACGDSEDVINIQTAYQKCKLNDIILITTNNPDLWRSIRMDVEAEGKFRYVLDLYKENPLSYSADNRVASLALASDEVYRNNVQGAVAEAGVYKGDFAKSINVLFPDRKLYLFDSFEGFNRQDVECGKDNHLQYDEWIDTLRDTSVDLVMYKMKYKENVVIKKGFVPETLEGIEDKFAFVNLDMDVYKPTYEALKFFWGKLNPGGYIFVHDFSLWDGIEEAVLKFCREERIGYVRLPDRVTVAIAKPIEI